MSNFHAVVIRIGLHINESQSLKSKRSVLRPLLSRLEKLRISVAEIGNQDSWQQSTIAVAVVAADAGRLTGMVEVVKRIAHADPRIDVTSIEVTHVEEP